MFKIFAVMPILALNLCLAFAITYFLAILMLKVLSIVQHFVKNIGIF